ncbi:type VI secretion system Vgr family protein, partial [Parachitinimonas caeni]
KHEIYDYPGQYVDPGVGEHYARVRIDELQARHERVVGQGPVRGLPVGYLFSLTEHPRGDQNRQYLVAQATLHLSESDYRSGGGEWEAQVDIQALPSNLPFRPERSTPKPIVQGPQTAVIVGPAGEEIWTDEHARVKVQFHWDRRGKKNDQSSCWVRVSQPWAGQNFGMVAIPRIGQEVVVSFLEGDPDQPLITGRVYNADQMPPWDLPGNKTQSGILSRSSQGGHYDHANALRFEDKKGAEEVWLHAEKDQRIEVEHDESHWVGNDRSKTVDHDETVHIKHDRTETVDHDETITVHNNRSERVDHNETISIGDNRDEDVGKNETVTIGKNQTFDVGQSRTKTVGKHEKDKIGRNWSINVGRFKTETINLAFLQNVGLAKMVNIGTVYNRNVGAMMLTTVGASRSDRIANNHTQKIGDNKTVNVGDTYSLTVGEGSHIVMDKDSITLNVGKATLVMKKNGNITLNGHDLNIGMSGDQRLKASGDITLKASKIHEN